MQISRLRIAIATFIQSLTTLTSLIVIGMGIGMGSNSILVSVVNPMYSKIALVRQHYKELTE